MRKGAPVRPMHWMVVIKLVPAVILVGASLSCSLERDASTAPDRSEQVKPASFAAASSGVASPGEEGRSTSANGSGSGAVWTDRKLVRNALVQMEVEQIQSAVDAIRKLARTNSGLLSNVDVKTDDRGHSHASVTLRVPEDRYDPAQVGLRTIGNVTQESSRSDDVTKAYTDLEIRLRVKRGTEERLRSLLADRTAALSDVLSAEREIERVVTEIEEMEGSRRFYDQQIAMSTIQVELRERSPILEAGSSSTIRTALRTSIGLMVRSLTILLYVMFLLLPWLILGALIAGLAVFIGRFGRRRLMARS